MQWTALMAFNNTMMAGHLHPEAVPTAVLGSIIATATVCSLGFMSATLQEDSLIKEGLAFWQPGKERIILQKFECATRTGQLDHLLQGAVFAYLEEHRP